MSDETSNPPEAEPYLTLARRGKEAWNAWRRENPDKKINFANVDFTRPENQDINFGGFEFGNGANFKGASFGDGPWIFDKESQTKLAQGGSPGGGAYFSGASFGEWANFSGASFGVWADFSRASFGTLASFSGASFGAMTNFSDVKFIGIVYFSNTKFDQNCRFVGSVFGGTAYFYYSKDKDTANEEELKKYLKDKKLENLDFSGSIFKDDIIFSGRELTGKLIFRHCRFNIPPDFSQVEGLERIDPTDAHFSIRPRQRGKIWGWISRNWTTDSERASRIRHLRKLMSDLKAHDVERDLFILERKAERGFLWRQVPRTWNPIRLLSPFLRALTPTLLMFLYGILSDCGRSLWRPFFFFAAKLGGFFYYYAGRISPLNYEYLTFDQGEGPLVTYWQLVKEIPQNPYLHDILSFTLTHALPLVGSLNPARTELLKRLFGEKICMPFGIEMMSLLQAGLGALFLFLLLLALRNHFKIS